MVIITSECKVVSFEEECIEGLWFPKYDVFKEVSIFGFPVFGKILNKEAFSDVKDAESFLKIVEDGRK